MSLTKEDLEGYVTDPNRIQRTILNYITAATNNELAIVDPTNPFTMLLEATAVNSANPIIHMKNTLKKIHPDLATEKESLYHHLADDELANMFATPAMGNIVFYLNIIELKQFGYRPTGANYVEVTVPEYTEVVVAETSFTLLNDIIVRLYDEGSVFVEQQSSTEDIAVNNLGILNSAITSDKENVSWLIFETSLKQVRRTVVSDTIVAAEGFNKISELNNQYFYSTVAYKNNKTENMYVQMNRTHSEEFIDPFLPTVFISHTDTHITHKIPDIYLLDGGISGNVNIVIYETKGKLFLPIHNFTLEDFKLTLGNVGKTQSTAVSTNITLLASSRNVVDGGLDSISIDELRKSIIFNTTGDIDLPITEYDIKKSGAYEGFEIFKAMDMITDRLYIASKNVTDIKSNVVASRADVFFNTATMVLADLTNTASVSIDDDSFIIKAGSVFKEDNGIISILSDHEMNNINTMSTSAKLIFFNENKYFFTPYYYIIDKTATVINSRIYDLDRPVMTDLKLIGKNNNVLPRINSDRYTITKTSTGYRIIISLIGNDAFKDLNPNMIKAQIAIPLSKGGVNIYHNTTFDHKTGYIIFDVESDFYVDEYSSISLTNGVSELSDHSVNLDTSLTLLIYSVDTAIIDPNKYLHSELYIDQGDSITIFSKESLKITFGKEIKYIWNKVNNVYSERLYKKYTKDIPLVHANDVYHEDPDSGAIFSLVTEFGEDEKLVYNIQHKKGDPVLDYAQQPVLKHKVGDNVIGEDGLPIIDLDNGIIRYIDIMMLEYEYKVATSLTYSNYLKLVLDLVDEWVFGKLPRLNSTVLENTSIVYKSYKTTRPVKITMNNVIHTMPYSVRPNIDLYSTRKDYSEDEIITITNNIGMVLHNNLDTIMVSHSKIKEDIINAVGPEIVGVKITGLDNVDGLEVFKITDTTTRLVLDKRLATNKNNELIVAYNLNLTIHNI